jgi:hypothetical protein
LGIDFAVIGSEFVNFISTVATCRIIRKAEKTGGLLKQMSYGELMDDLSSAWRRADALAEPSSDDGFLGAHNTNRNGRARSPWAFKAGSKA